jgi:CheY-like chemotaxis protein
MPERDGYEVAAFIKGSAELAHIPVLLLTGAFEPIDESRARAVGCDGVLVKPFEPQMVINRVKDLLAGRRPPGIWAAPAAQTASRQPESAAPALSGPGLAPQASAPAGGGSLEDYFDRLDAAFAGLEVPSAESHPEPDVPAASPASGFDIVARPEPSPVPSSTAVGDDLGGWDPDLSGDPKRPAPPAVPPPNQPAALPAIAAAPAAAPAPSPVVAPSHPQPVPQPVAPPASVSPAPSLADAFAALLSAERAHPVTPSAIGAPAPIVTDEALEEITRRVIARMSEQAVRDTVLDVAERLVREEIERIKGG